MQDLRAANGSEIPSAKAKEAMSDEILVPLLVSRDIVQRPIIGFNAIVEMLINIEDKIQLSESIVMRRNSLRLGSGKAEVLLNLTQGATNENVVQGEK